MSPGTSEKVDRAEDSAVILQVYRVLPEGHDGFSWSAVSWTRKKKYILGVLRALAVQAFSIRG